MSKESPLVAMYRYRVSRIILFIRFPESQSSGSRTPSPDDIYCPFIRFNSVSLIYGSSLCTCRDVSVPRITNHTVHSLPGIPAKRLPHVPPQRYLLPVHSVQFSQSNLWSFLPTCRDVSVPRITNHTVHPLPGIPVKRLPHSPPRR